jgi:predicted outer membrane protein
VTVFRRDRRRRSPWAAGMECAGTCDAFASAMRSLNASLASLASLLVCVTVAACDDSDDNNNGDTRDQAMSDGNARGQQVSVQARTELQDTADPDTIAMAASIVSTVNAGEIMQATFVLNNSSDTRVLDLAGMILADHQNNESELRQQMNDLGLAEANSSVAATLKNEATMGLAQLQADAKANLDVDYVQMQVVMHQEVSVLLDNVVGYVDDPDFRDFLSSTNDAVKNHRDHAGDVLDDLTD